jgi:hypothetical protein
MTYPGKPVPLKVTSYFLVGDMPGAVYVKRSTFNVENSSLPTPCGGRLTVAALAPDYCPSVPAQALAPCHRAATRPARSLSTQVPGVIIRHSPATPDHFPSLAVLQNDDDVASHDACPHSLPNHRFWTKFRPGQAPDLALVRPIRIALSAGWPGPTADAATERRGTDRKERTETLIAWPN